MPIIAPRAGVNQACLFNGTTDFYRRAANDVAARMHGAGGLTIASWCNFSSKLATTIVPLCVLNSFAACANLYFDINGSNILGTNCRANAEANVPCNAPVTIPKSWHMLSSAVSYDASRISLYVDGAIVSQVNAAAFSQKFYNGTSAAASFTVGGNGLGGTLGWNGLLCDQFIYDRELSPDEVYALYCGYVPSRPLVWSVPDGPNDRFSDVSGNGYHTDTKGNSPVFVPGGPWG